MSAMLLVLVLALLLFGPKKTYALAIEVGRYIGMLKRTARDLQNQLDITSTEAARHFSSTDAAQEIIFSPSNVTLPGRKVDDISDPQALSESEASGPEMEHQAHHEPAGAD